MKMNQLGRTGIEVSELCLQMLPTGTAAYPVANLSGEGIVALLQALDELASHWQRGTDAGYY